MIFLIYVVCICITRNNHTDVVCPLIARALYIEPGRTLVPDNDNKYSRRYSPVGGYVP